PAGEDKAILRVALEELAQGREVPPLVCQLIDAIKEDETLASLKLPPEQGLEVGVFTPSARPRRNPSSRVEVRTSLSCVAELNKRHEEGSPMRRCCLRTLLLSGHTGECKMAQ